MKSHNLFSLIKSIPSWPFIKCSCGSTLSRSHKKIPPSNMPNAIIPAPFALFPAAFKPGMINEKEVAASITPAPKPIKMSCILSETFFVKNMGSAPRPVASPASKLNTTPTSHIG